jgi:hypothetical protein
VGRATAWLLLAGDPEGSVAKLENEKAGAPGSTSGKGVGMERVLLVDFENIQAVNLEQIEEGTYRVCVFVGELQNKIPLELVRSAQRLGGRLEWLKVDGTGRNALDFHIAYYLGLQVERNRGGEYIILSKDKGFDPLVRYVTKQNVKCRRINSIMEIVSARKVREHDQDYRKTIENLRKIERGKRPRKRNTLRQHVKALLGKSATEERLNEIIDQLFIEGFVSEENGVVTYQA